MPFIALTPHAIWIVFTVSGSPDLRGAIFSNTN
jgi:hypothetical protein